MSKTVTFVVDGQKLQAPEGALLLPVLLNHGISVPHFCYHEALGPDGNCRMCMVSIEGQKRPQVACDTPIRQDMVISTKNEAINEVKRKILELELLSHPVDCPICDQAGECSLQNYYMEFGLNESRRSKEEKKHKDKRVDIGKNIILDQERCVLCARCTRFTQEITHTNELAIIGRGNDARVSTLPGEGMRTPYAMNIIDLCPVGALTSKDFRFRQRVWFMHSSKGICHGCAKGCNIYLDHNQEKYKSDTLFRFRPRVNSQVNGHFICDEGRLSYRDENRDRLDGYYQHNTPLSKELALAHLERVLREHKPLLIVSPSLSLEELYVIVLLAEHYGLELNAYEEGYQDKSFEDDWLRSRDRSANLTGVKRLGIPTSTEDLRQALQASDLIINFNHKAFIHPDATVQGFLIQKREIHIVSHLFEDAFHKELLIPINSYSEHQGTLINEDHILQRYDAGLCNAREGILALLHELISSPKSIEEVWDTYLNDLLGCRYDEIPPQGREV